MYGWLCGIIRSKLALSVSFAAATIASTTVITPQTTTTASRLLKISRSSRLPELRSKSARSRTTGMRSSESVPMAMVSPVLLVQRLRADPARAGDIDCILFGADDRRRRRRPLDLERLEARAVVGADEDVARLADEHQAPRIHRAAGEPVLEAGLDLLPGLAAVGAAERVALRPNTTALFAPPVTPNSVPWYGSSSARNRPLWASSLSSNPCSPAMYSAPPAGRIA